MLGRVAVSVSARQQFEKSKRKRRLFDCGQHLVSTVRTPLKYVNGSGDARLIVLCNIIKVRKTAFHLMQIGDSCLLWFESYIVWPSTSILVLRNTVYIIISKYQR